MCVLVFVCVWSCMWKPMADFPHVWTLSIYLCVSFSLSLTLCLFVLSLSLSLFRFSLFLSLFLSLFFSLSLSHTRTHTHIHIIHRWNIHRREETKAAAFSFEKLKYSRHVLKCVAVCCSELQRVTVWCSVLLNTSASRFVWISHVSYEWVLPAVGSRLLIPVLATRDKPP